MTVTSGSVVAMKFIFGMCDCTVDGNVVMSNFFTMLEILHVWTCAFLRVDKPKISD